MYFSSVSLIDGGSVSVEEQVGAEARGVVLVRSCSLPVVRCLGWSQVNIIPLFEVF